MIKTNSRPRVGRRILTCATVIMAVILVAPGCASSGSSDRGASDVLTRTQLEPVDHLTAWDAVRRFRPLWLRTARGQDTFNDDRGTIRVYVDDVFMGGPEVLRDEDVREIEEIRYLDSRQATTRFGMDHPSGAIMITLR